MKTFEEFITPSEEDQPIDLVGYPSGSIIEVTPQEFDELQETDFDIRWDNEPDYEEGIDGQWRYMDEEDEAIEDWLEQRRDPMGYTAKKYNI